MAKTPKRNEENKTLADRNKKGKGIEHKSKLVPKDVSILNG